MMYKKIILIDIDHTLINSRYLLNDAKAFFKKFFIEYHLEIESEKFWKIYLSIMNNESQELRLSLRTVFSKFISEMNLNEEITWSNFRKIYQNLDYENAKIKQSACYLEKLRTSAILGIFSEGDRWYQLLKLQKSGLFHFFNNKHLHIYKNKLRNLAKIPAGVIIADDSERIEAGIKEMRNDIMFVKIEKDVGITGKKYSEILENLKKI